MWTYSQTTGELHRAGKLFATCYSGHGKTPAEGRNNPAMEAVPGKGPIPRGRWRMTGVKDSANTGPFSILLIPVGHDAHLRDLFRLHGNNKTNDASRGCIILSPLALRRAIWDSGDHDLEVVL